MRVAIGGDSVGVELAGMLAEYLSQKPHLTIVNMSGENPKAEFYANLSERVGQAILAGEVDRAILVCGTGIGVCMSANKIPGIRAAQTHDTYSAQRAALSNDAHIITFGARVIGPELAKSIADAWLACAFDPQSPSAQNVKAVNDLDKKYSKPK